MSRAHAKAAPDKSKPCVRCAASVHPSGPKLCKVIYEMLLEIHWLIISSFRSVSMRRDMPIRNG